jgi:hypothetical protein
LIAAVRPSIARRMRLLCRLLALVAVLLMPLGMNTASAAPPTAHNEMAGMPMGHCPDEGSPAKSEPGIAACTMICGVALPAADARMPGYSEIAALPAEILSIKVLAGLHPEAADPPPKPA